MVNKIDAPCAGSNQEKITGGDVIRLISSKAWPGISSGDISNWPVSLRTAINIIIDSPLPMCVALGKDHIQLYNNAFKNLIGNKHPLAFGKSSRDTFSDNWDVLEPGFTQALQGDSLLLPQLRLPLWQHGIKGIYRYQCSFSPLKNEDNVIIGVLATFIEMAETGENTEKPLPEITIGFDEHAAQAAASVNQASYSLAESEHRFKNLVMRSPIAMAIFRGSDLVVELANTAMLEKVWRRPMEEVKGRKLLEIFPELLEQPFPALLNKVFLTGEKCTDVEAPALISIGGELKQFYFNFEYNPLLEANGSVSGIMVTVYDVTQQVEAKQLIRDAEQRSRLAIEAASMGTFDWDLVTRKFTCSPRLAAIFGYPGHENLDHQILLGGLHPEDRPVRNMALAAALNSGALHYEARIIMPDKNFHWIKVYGKIVYNDANEPLQMYGMVTDITEEKTTLTALAESESRLNVAINAGKLATYDVDLVTNAVSCSTRFYEVFDIEPNTGIIREEIIDRVHPDDVNIRNKAHEIARQTGNLEYELRLIWRDKSVHWIKANGIYLYNDERVPIRILGTAMDITEQKFYINQLKESEQRFKVVADSAPVMLWMSDTESCGYFFNKAWLQFTGRSYEEEYGDGWTEGIHPEDREASFDIYRRSLAKRESFYMECRLRRHDGVYRWISDNGTPRFGIDGAFLGYVGGCMDIDDQKRQNAELSKSEARLRIAALSGELGTWDYDPVNNELFWDEACGKIFGIPYRNRDSVDMLWSILNSDDRTIASQKAKLALDPALAAPFEIEFRVRHSSDNSIHWINGKGKAFFKNGKPYRFAGTVLDITQKKLALESLKESELLFKTISNTSPVGLWLTDERGQNIFINNTWISWTGISFEDHIKNGWYQLLHDEDKKNIVNLLDKAFEKREKFSGQFRFTNKNHDTCWCLTEGYPYFTNDGNFAGYAGSITDITEQLTAMDALKKSEERFRLLANAMPQFIWTADPVGYLNYFNQAIYDYTGFTKDTVYDQGWFTIIHPEDRDITIERWVDSIKSGTNFSCEHRYKRKDGVYRWQLSRALPQRDINGVIQMWIGSSTDIHDQKLASEELENKVRQRTAELQRMNEEIIQQKDFVEIIIDSSLIMVTVFDSDKRIISYNKKCEEVFTNRKEDVLGKEFHKVFPGIELSQTYQNLELALQGETVHVSSYKSVVNNNYYESYFVPLRDNNDYVYAVLMTAHDITDIIQSTEKVQQAYGILEEQNKALERSNRELESFSYVASHDLQEPLRKIQTFIELLHRNLDNKEASEKYFNKITSSAQRMSALIRDVLNYSRLAKQGEPFAPVDLNVLMEEVITDFELLITEKQADIFYHDLPVIVGVPLQLNQLFTNLLSNALKFSTDKPEIRIDASVVAAENLLMHGLNEQQSYIHIRFRDNGIGFEQQFAEKIFAIFQRLNNRDYSGTGIGLALCKKIVENHNGVIVGESEAGLGSTFHIYLPLS